MAQQSHSHGPVAHALTARRLRNASSANDWKMASTFEAFDFQYDRIAWFAFHVDLWFGTR